MRRAIVGLFLLLPGFAPGPAWAGELARALHDRRWAEAAAMVAGAADPVAGKLVLYERLLTPAGGTAAEIAAFLDSNPAWPNRAVLARRLSDALAAEADSSVARNVCQRHEPADAPALLRCARAQVEFGDLQAAASTAAKAWEAGITTPADEQAFLLQWGATLTPADQWHRFDQLAWSDRTAPNGPAERQIARLLPAQRALATARLKLRHDDPAGQVLAAILPSAFAADPIVMLECARFLRRTGQDAEAQALWLSDGAAAESAAAAERRPAFWAERDLLARHRLREQDAVGAYALVDSPPGLAPEQVADAEFLAGFIALRRLNDAAAATRHFATLRTLGRAALTQARATYWLGRAATAQGDPAAAHSAYLAASAWPTTFYGQLASRALGEDDATLAARIRALQGPAWSQAQALDVLGNENARAAALLIEWGEPRQARAFLTRLDEQAADAPGQAIAARLAQELGMTDLAVLDARRAGSDGVILPDAGWPLAETPPLGPVEPALTLGLIRQESNFNTEALSPTGARGLMQLMPATAQTVAVALGEPPTSLAALTSDPGYNMRLGTTYMAALLNQFGGAMPLAIAAYNAGPNRVVEWLTTIGNPGSGNPGGSNPATSPRAIPQAGTLPMLDWIELIPFGETRNYVERVLENVVIYRARAGLVMPNPLARWLG